MPTHLRHRHRLGHGPCSTRLRALGPTRSAALPLGACGPAHKGQLSVEPTGASTKAGTWHRQYDILKEPVATSTKISQAYNFHTGGYPAIIFSNTDQSINSKRKRGGDNTISSVKVRQTMPNHTSFVVTSGSTPVEAIPDELASTDAWHQFLSSTRVAGLDAGVMG